jgi:hypothetical protein
MIPILFYHAKVILIKPVFSYQKIADLYTILFFINAGRKLRR